MKKLNKRNWVRAPRTFVKTWTEDYSTRASGLVKTASKGTRWAGKPRNRTQPHRGKRA